MHANTSLGFLEAVYKAYALRLFRKVGLVRGLSVLGFFCLGPKRFCFFST